MKIEAILGSIHNLLKGNYAGVLELYSSNDVLLHHRNAFSTPSILYGEDSIVA